MASAITSHFVGLIKGLDNGKGKVSISELEKLLGADEEQNKILELLKQLAPKAKRAKSTKLKDPNAPKRPLTPYFFFMGEQRDILKKENPSWTFQELRKALSVAWRSLTPKAKKKYEALYASAKEKYTEEMKGYTRPSEEELAKLDVNKPKTRKPRTTSAKSAKSTTKSKPKVVIIADSDDDEPSKMDTSEDTPVKPKKTTKKLTRVDSD